MNLSGLSNQHENLQRLLACFPESHQRDCELYQMPTVGRLLRHLLTREGPRLWVGSSLSVVNFVARDTTYDDDRVPALAFADVSGDNYRIWYPPARELNVPGDAKTYLMDNRVERAGECLLQAIEHSNANPNRITAAWNWYVCPACDYHHAHYLENCVRCEYHFPIERKCQLFGILRRPEIPEGAVAPHR